MRERYSDSRLSGLFLPLIGLLWASLLSPAAESVTIIPDKEGFDGDVNIGGGGIGAESDWLAKLTRGIVDVGDLLSDAAAEIDPDSTRFRGGRSWKLGVQYRHLVATPDDFGPD